MAGRMEVQKEDRLEDHSVDQKEAPKVGQMEVQTVDRLVGRREVRTQGRLVGRMEVQTVDRLVGRMEVRTVDRLVGRMEVQKEGLMAVHLVDLQDLLEVRAALHRFAQLVPVPVQARLPVLRAMVVLGLEVVFA